MPEDTNGRNYWKFLNTTEAFDPLMSCEERAQLQRFIESIPTSLILEAIRQQFYLCPYTALWQATDGQWEAWTWWMGKN